MRAVSAVVLALVAVGVEGTYDCSGALIDWREHPSTYISCHAKGQSTSGSLEDQKRLCEELEDACSGVTCEGSPNSCTARHHHDGSSECTEHVFLAPSRGETSYTKSCRNCRWQEVKNHYIPCFAKEPEGGEDISLEGTLLERQIECHELGADCIGVTCADPPDNTRCTVRNHRVCSDNKEQLMEGSGEVSYIKLCGVVEPPKDDIPVGGPLPPEPLPADNCAWSTSVDTDLTCRVARNDQKGDLITKKKQCESMGRDCAGVSCTGEALDSCQLHEHVGCIGENGYLETKRGVVTHLKSCLGMGLVCEHPCYYTKETDHKCNTNCDCTGYRWCNKFGWCDGGDSKKMVHEKVCLNGTWATCGFSAVENHYISCIAAGVSNEMPLTEAERRCVELGSECMGVTCSKDGKCSVRHHAQCSDGNYLEQSTKGETSYTKACGHSAVRGRGSQGSTTLYLTYTIVLLTLLILLLVSIICRNRMNVRAFAGGVGYGQVVQHAELDEDDHEREPEMS
eukprot:Hpha_TRINITY_DN12846_c0_g3::TRINITY_DN12846_c0_g3_i1::g.24185::m.24185